MRRLGRRRDRTGADEHTAVLAMALLAAPRTVDTVFVIDACQRLFPTSVVGDAEGTDPFSFSLDGCAVHLVVMPMPIPDGEAERAGEISALWPDAARDVSGCGAHAIVFVTGPMDPRSTHLVAQRAIAAVLDATQALGVYIGDAGHLIRTDMWVDRATAEPDEIVRPFWFAAHAGYDEAGRVDAFTRGLAAFGVPDLQIIGSTKDRGDVWEFIGDIAYYLIDNGDVIKDGDTVGTTAEQKIIASVARSRFGLDGSVLQLSF